MVTLSRKETREIYLAVNESLATYATDDVTAEAKAGITNC